MRLRNGLILGGRIQRHEAAYSVRVMLLAMHRPSEALWSWFVGFARYRRSSGFKNRLFAVTRIRGCHSFVYVDLLGLGHLTFCRRRGPRSQLEARLESLEANH